jgi:conjugative transfer signal peptidase TraF
MPVGFVVLCNTDYSDPRQVEGVKRGYDSELPLVKRVAATCGDVVSVNDDGVVINGICEIHSRPVAYDRRGEPLRKADLQNYTLKSGEVLLLGETDTSWDGRYFGVVSLSRCASVLVPVMTWR